MTELSRARQELDDLADELSALGVGKGMIFGHHGLKTPARKVFVFEHGDALVFRLRDDPYDTALALPGAHVFKPMADRPAMRNWIVVPDDHVDEWPELARTALELRVAD